MHTSRQLLIESATPCTWQSRSHHAAHRVCSFLPFKSDVLHSVVPKLLSHSVPGARSCFRLDVRAAVAGLHQMGLFSLFSFLNPSKQTKHTLKPGSAARDIVVPVDDSQHSLEALEWAVTNIYRPDRADQLHLLSVVPRVAGPYPAEVLEADVPAASSSTVKAWRSEQYAHESETEALLSFMQHHAVNLGVKAGHVQATPLAASGGASGVGASIANYVESCDADMVVLGSRGLHGWHRHVYNLLGLGSVSYYTMLRVPCPVVVVKGDES